MDAYDLQINKGATYSLNITVKDSNSVPINLSGYTTSGFLKFRYSDSGKLTSLNASGVAPLASGVINLSIPATVTANLPTSLCFYDVEISNISGDGSTTKVLRGKAVIEPEITW